MCNEQPDVKREGVYNVKETCYYLAISKDTLNNRRRRGLITPLNPCARSGFRYLGAEIIRFWRSENFLDTDIQQEIER